MLKHRDPLHLSIATFFNTGYKLQIHNTNLIIDRMAFRSKLARSHRCDQVMPVPVVSTALVKQLPQPLYPVPPTPAPPIPPVYSFPFPPIPPNPLDKDTLIPPPPPPMPDQINGMVAIPYFPYQGVPFQFMHQPVSYPPFMEGTYQPPPAPPTLSYGPITNQPSIHEAIKIMEYPPPSDPSSGTILTNVTGSTPTGYLDCDGSAVSRTMFPTLFVAIGTQYGEGDQQTTFTLPNLSELNGTGIFYIIKI